MLKLENFDALRLSLASPDTILSWSHGEVTKPETINYRTLRPERDGLFCERIFGPTRDWECHCGKYKRYRYKGIICDKCGVEVTRAKVRRERMGHIKLASPVSHVWYFKGIPSRMGLLLDMSPRNLEKILYFANYIVTDVNEDLRREMLESLGSNDRADKIRADREGAAQELRSSRQAELDSVRSEVTEALAGIDDRLRSELAVLDEQAAALQEQLTAAVGTKAKKALVIGRDDTEETVIVKGETIDEATAPAVLRKVQEKKELLEAQARAEREDAQRRLEDEQRRVEHEIEQAMSGDADTLQAELEQLQMEVETTRADLEALHVKQILTDTQYREYHERFGRVFRAGIGAEAIRDLLGRINLTDEMYRLREESRTTTGQRKQKAIKRLKVVEDFRKSNSSPAWMVLDVLPVIPPELRPMVQLDGGRFATSDLNDLYRRVINRNNRLKRLLELGAPEIIVRNEKRMLQEAVDALIDNGRRGRAITGTGNRKLKSLSDLLKGKQGRFRQNLLGKRVDYSGRSVIVVGPELKLHECGLPKKMALELFKPFVMRELVNKGYTTNIKSAKRMVERMRPEVWDVLDEVIHEHPVLLNRAPTLHRLGIQAFMPVLVEGSAIHIHPLVCHAFNADFDGDQMAVHVPLFSGAIAEAKNLMMSSQNILSAADGHPVVAPTQDIVLGCYWLTAARGDQPKGEAVSKLPAFSNHDEVLLALGAGAVQLHQWIRVRESGRMLVTTPGRVEFNEVLPVGRAPMEGVDAQPLEFQNAHLDRKALRVLVSELFRLHGSEVTAAAVNEIKRLGFRYATKAGITISAFDIPHATEKPAVLESTEKEADEVERMYRRGVMTEDERYRKVIELWTQATDQVGNAAAKAFDPFSPIWMMMGSGARGNLQQLKQLAGMRGLMADPTGRIIDLPIKANFTEGLTVLEYFISTHGARKGLADTALRTADSGYLTRRLVDVAQDVIVRTEDCETTAGIWVRDTTSGDLEITAQKISGRIAAEEVVDPSGNVLVPAGEAITDALARQAIAAGADVKIRSVLTCEAKEGVCGKCYGRNLATGRMVEIGEAVGVIAAQSIGEPGTQLTMRTFHTGGVASAADITQGLPRVEELFEARIPKGKAIISEIDGELEVIRQDSSRKVRVTSRETFEVAYPLEEGMKPLVKTGDQVMEGQELARNAETEQSVRTRHAGTARVGKKEVAVSTLDEEMREYPIPHNNRIRPELERRSTQADAASPVTIRAGQQITEGHVSPQELLHVLGKEAVQTFLVDEVQQVYRSQGVDINDKHIEVIVRQMMRKVRVETAGDTMLLPGEIVSQWEYEEANAAALAEGGEPATAATVLLGLIKAALNTTSWLSAASFQETTRVLTEAAISGKIDRLRGLKENVIIGKLIPAGTGLDYYKKAREAAAKMVEEEPIDLDSLSV